MKMLKRCVLLTLTAVMLTSGTAMADRGRGGHWHGSVGVYVGPGFGGGFGPGYRPYYPRPFYGPTFYGDPYYYGYPPAVVYSPPPVIVAPAPQPPVYIEQAQQAPQIQAPQVQAPQQPQQPAPPANSPATASADQQDYSWYHCDKPEGYYPYVKECPQGWQKVPPQPPK